jgi:hypothetical protein
MEYDTVLEEHLEDVVTLSDEHLPLWLEYDAGINWEQLALRLLPPGRAEEIAALTAGEIIDAIAEHGCFAPCFHDVVFIERTRYREATAAYRALRSWFPVPVPVSTLMHLSSSLPADASLDAVRHYAESRPQLLARIIEDEGKFLLPAPKAEQVLSLLHFAECVQEGELLAMAQLMRKNLGSCFPLFDSPLWRPEYRVRIRAAVAHALSAAGARTFFEEGSISTASELSHLAAWAQHLFVAPLPVGVRAALIGDCEDCAHSREVDSLPHYTRGAIECIDAIKASMTPVEFNALLKGQTMKYLWRYQHKGAPVQDLHKAQWYLSRLIEEVEGGVF